MTPNDPKTLKNMLKHVFEPFRVVLDGFGAIPRVPCHLCPPYPCPGPNFQAPMDEDHDSDEEQFVIDIVITLAQIEINTKKEIDAYFDHAFLIM